MNYTIEMFRNDFPKLKDEHFHKENFRYAIALENMDPWDGDWGHDREAFKFCFARVGSVVGGGMQWIYKMNCHQKIKKGEVFICMTNHVVLLHSAVRATGVMTLPKIYKNFKIKDNKDRRISSFLFKAKWKKQQPIWNWFNAEMNKINDLAQHLTRELNQSFCYLEFNPTKPTPKFLCKASKKRIKTEYGYKNNCYNSDFEINFSPYDGEKIDCYEKVKARYANHKNFKNAEYPIYEVERNGHTYLFEKCDLCYLEQEEVNKIEIEYVNKWEDALMVLQKKERQLKRWRDRCLKQIEDCVYKNYTNYRRI